MKLAFRTRRRTRLALVVALAATAAGCSATAVAGGHPSPTMSSAMPGMSSAMPRMAPPLLVRVLGTRSARNYLDVDVNGQRSDTEQTVALPYSVSVTGQAESVVVLAQAQGGTRSTTISCAITMAGMSTTTGRASGPGSAVSCEVDP
jgi:hypothetical protein